MSKAPARSYLLVNRKTGEKHELRDGFSVGRAEGDLRIREDNSVSSHQGVFSLDQEGPSFTDVGSRNGTRINGKRLTPRKAGRLKPGDKIRFGETIFKVLLDGPEPDALPMEDAAGPASPPSDVAEARAPAKPFESPKPFRLVARAVPEAGAKTEEPLAEVPAAPKGVLAGAPAKPASLEKMYGKRPGANQRLFGYFIDGAIFQIASVIVANMEKTLPDTARIKVMLPLYAFLGLYFFFRDAAFETGSLGKRIAGIELLGLGETPLDRIKASALRNSPFGVFVVLGVAAALLPPSIQSLPFYLIFAVCAVEYLAAAYSSDGRRYGDRLAGTTPIDVRDGANGLKYFALCLVTVTITGFIGKATKKEAGGDATAGARKAMVEKIVAQRLPEVCTKDSLLWRCLDVPKDECSSTLQSTLRECVSAPLPMKHPAELKDEAAVAAYAKDLAECSYTTYARRTVKAGRVRPNPECQEVAKEFKDQPVAREPAAAEPK